MNLKPHSGIKLRNLSKANANMDKIANVQETTKAAASKFSNEMGRSQKPSGIWMDRSRK